MINYRHENNTFSREWFKCILHQGNLHLGVVQPRAVWHHRKRKHENQAGFYEWGETKPYLLFIGCKMARWILQTYGHAILARTVHMGAVNKARVVYLSSVKVFDVNKIF